jgi:hypothetical protein
MLLAACGGSGGGGGTGGTDTNSKKCQKHPQYKICQGGNTTPSTGP